MAHAPTRLIAVIALLASLAASDTPTHSQSSPLDPTLGVHATAPYGPARRQPTPPVDLPIDPIGWDPLGLIGDVSVMRRYSGGDDMWEVWICDLPHGYADIDAAAAAEVLTGELTPYFSRLSEGTYRLIFLPAGQAAPTPGDDYPCQTQVEQRSSGHANGAIVITDQLNIPAAYAYPDIRLTASSGAAPDTFPDNRRIVRVGAHVALPDAWNFEPKRAAHEIGHALSWPHSYHGDTEDASQYNNPLDVMSGALPRQGALKGRPQGTLAINRYAAGWIEPAQVAIHTADTAEYRLGPVGTDGLQLLILPTNDRGTYTVLDVRISQNHDTGLAKEGVTVHTIDQSPDACNHPTPAGCFGHQRRTQPALSDHETARAYTHVLAPGASLHIDHHQIQVLQRHGDRFSVQITDLSATRQLITDDLPRSHPEPNT